MRRRRLDELLASCGHLARREVKAGIRAGRILVDGRTPASPGLKVDPASVLIDGAPPDHPDGLLVLMHKAADRVCSHDATEGPGVYDDLPPLWRRRNPALNTVGRLDKDTTGALLLTDQGTLIHAWTHPKRKVEKVYRVTLRDPLAPELIPIFASGQLLLEGEREPCHPALLEILGPHEARLTLTEGRFHQVKRMFAVGGNEVTALHRERFGPHTVDDLAPGAWRILPLPDHP